MPAPYKTTRLVEFHDTDMAGIMHFASFFHYMESVEHELIRSIGFSVHSRINGDLLSFPRVSAKCDFYSPARSEDILDVEIWLTKIGTKSLHYQLDFRVDDRAVATGNISSVCCRVEPGEPIESVPLPSEFVEKIQQYLIPQ